MGVIVQFDFDKFVNTYPEFASLSVNQAEALFDVASVLHRNDGGGPVNNANTQLVLLNMLVAHLAKLGQLNPDGTVANPLVGRINSATEGSVTVSAEMSAGEAGSRDYFYQTQYGALYWTATQPYRTMRYLPGPRRFFNPVFSGRIGWR